MEQNVQQLLSAKNEMIIKGQILDAAETYFASSIKTIDFDGSIIGGKEREKMKLQQFLGSIEKVNEITLHRSAISGNVSFSEFTFSFTMKDRTEIYWHEIIRSLWENDKIIEEQYFKG